MYSASRSALHGHGHIKVLSNRHLSSYLALAAIDVAAWDLYASRLALPLGVAMGGSPRPVRVYGSGGFFAFAETTEQAAMDENDSEALFHRRAAQHFAAATDPQARRAIAVVAALVSGRPP